MKFEIASKYSSGGSSRDIPSMRNRRVKNVYTKAEEREREKDKDKIEREREREIEREIHNRDSWRHDAPRRDRKSVV